MKKKSGIIELLVAGSLGVAGIGFFAAMQTRQPYRLTQIRFCPQSANHPNAIAQNIDELNKQRSTPQKNLFGQPAQTKRAAKPEDFNPDGQRVLDERFCYKPRYVLAEEWERYGKFGSKIPFKGAAISKVSDVDLDNPNYPLYNLGAIACLWGVTGCVLFRVNKLKRRDFEFSEQEKSIAYTTWLEEANRRDLQQFASELDLSLTKEVRSQKHEMMRDTLGVADTENEAYRNRLQVETTLLGREAHHAELRKQIAEKHRDAAKADAERLKVQGKGAIADENEEQVPETTEQDIKKQGTGIVSAIADFGLSLEYIGAFKAPSVVRHRFKFGTGKKSKIADFQKLADDLALALGLKDTPRIVRDKAEIIVEVPREDREYPHINDALKMLKKPDGDSVILIGGIDFNGDLMHLNVLESPDCHGLGAGTTKSGKTQGIYAQIAALISMYSPDEVKLAIYDGKMSLILPEELKPWLFCETAIAGQGGEYINAIEDERQSRISIREGYRDITEFNQDNPEERLPYLVCLMDEYSVDREAFEGDKNNPDSNTMKRLGKMARSEGIHLLPFDQDAKKENIDTRVKTNLGFRIVYRMVDRSASDYLEIDGAEKLLGRGDVIIKWEGRQYRCQMPNCSPKDLAAIAKARTEELGIVMDSASPKQMRTAAGTEWDWYEALQIWALENEPTRDHIKMRWVKLSGSEPNKEQLDIFLEHLAVLNGD